VNPTLAYITLYLASFAAVGVILITFTAWRLLRYRPPIPIAEQFDDAMRPAVQRLTRGPRETDHA
jgi:hypothetical protein